MMRNQLKLMLKIVLFVSLIANVSLAQAMEPVTINKETAAYILDIKYPQGFQNKDVDTAVSDFIASTQKSFLGELSEDDDTPADAPGKTGLNVRYTVPYDSNAALSLRFEISIYHKGAAHPINTVVVLNFINGQKVALADLFAPNTDSLKVIANFCNKAITAMKISDANWIKEGTKPTIENYSVWAFNTKGIEIIFNNYQVAAYVYGAQSVVIPLPVFASMIKPSLAKTVWGS